MAETTQPLLNESNSSSTPPRSLDETIESYIGTFGWAQFLQASLVSFSGVFDAQQTFISVFTDSEPTWHCTDSVICHESISNICILPKTAWSWDYSPHVSIISEWGLQCAGSFIKGLPESSFFVGCLIGGLVLSTLADSSLGRKNILFLSCLVMSISTMLTVFSPNIWVYALLRFVNGFGRATIGTCAIVLSTELVGKKWRGRVGVMSFFGFMLGFLSLPLIAYLNRGNSWKILYLCTSIPTMIYCVLVRFFVCESPRWLFVRGRKEEAISILKRVASIPSSDVNFSSLPYEEEEEKVSNANIFTAMKVLVEKRWALKRLSAVMVIAFGIGLVYYGMPLALSNLDVNIYLSTAFNALMDLPANLITLFLVDKLSRRNALIGFTALGGVSSVIIFALQNMRVGNHGSLQLALELISYFSACSAFNIEMIYTIELFPTCVRNTAIAMARQALVLGGVFSPIMVAAGRKNGVWSFGLFGLAIGLLGLFAVGLPETRGSVLCDTMDEEECKDQQSNNDLVTRIIVA